LNDIWKGVKPFKEMYDNPKTIGKVIDETWEKTGWLNNKHLFGDIQDIHKFKINGVEKELTGNLDDLMAQLKKGKDKFEYIGKVGTKKPGLFAKLGNRTVGITQDVAKVTSKVGLRTTAGTIRTAATLGKVVGSATLIGLVAELGITFLTSSVVEKYGRFLRSRQAVTIIPLTYRSKPFVAGINGHQGMVYGDSPGALDSFFAGTGWGGGVISGLYWLFGIEAPDYSGETGTDELSEQRG
jgi:hypothetical protein